MTDDNTTCGGIDIFIAIPRGDGGVEMDSTGLKGFIDDDGDFIIPYQDDLTAEEVGRIITGSIRRKEREG